MISSSKFKSLDYTSETTFAPFQYSWILLGLKKKKKPHSPFGEINFSCSFLLFICRITIVGDDFSIEIIEIRKLINTQEERKKYIHNYMVRPIKFDLRLWSNRENINYEKQMLQKEIQLFIYLSHALVTHFSYHIVLPIV